ncbi:hypothetical protein QUB80_23175 [Chlorogloeopsis sp. ULAP01]|uniref:hypothetical protein n=1 Tax=Chlorogloeopsis TaxID=1123 RepID=UPI0019EF41B5|nr:MULTISPECIES: hypothetical protein [Chlorogloeopsis]MBF2004483.1 hypothetical protein [Chlorogloeopsis fritschii C42_A2020_084]MDM9383594.1 hypothetical protein [Chlorogloeopsis sp. ULAP01]
MVFQQTTICRIVHHARSAATAQWLADLLDQPTRSLSSNKRDSSISIVCQAVAVSDINLELEGVMGDGK